MENLKRISTLSTKEDFEYIILGGALLGSGGGGPISAGLQIMDDILLHGGKIFVVQPEEIAHRSDLYGAVVAFMGSPSAGAHGIDLETPTNAFNALSVVKPLSFAMLIELGAGNSMVPMSVAVRKKIPIVDADGAGRAVPKIQNTTYAQSTSPSPAALSNGEQESKPTIDNLIFMRDLPQEKMADSLEEYCLELLNTSTFGQMGGLATYLLSGEEVIRAAIPGTVTLSYYVGRIIIDSIKSKNDPVSSLRVFFKSLGIPFYSFGYGEVIKCPNSNEPDNGLDVGIVCIRDDSCVILELKYENENLFASIDGKPWGMAPDLLCYISKDGPLSNVEIKLGDCVSVLGIGCNQALRTSSIVKSFMDELKRLDIYKGEYIPIEKIHG